MKLKTILAAALIAAASFNALAAAADKPADEPKAVADEAKTEKASPTKVKPHSHMEEKTGVPQKASDAKPEKANAAKDKSKHYHPRDR